jgi:hypothetical protein
MGGIINHNAWHMCVGPAEYEQCLFGVVLWKCWLSVGVWGVDTLLGPEETTLFLPLIE